MALQILHFIPAIALFLWLTSASTIAQDINTLKSGVVRIRNTKTSEVGTGFIVKVDKNVIYIVTASHVVRGNENPEVYLYNRQEQEPLLAKLKAREDENQKGLALLTLKTTDLKTLSGITAVIFGDSTQLNGGEPIKVIGFPDSTSIWTVSSGAVSRVEGNYLVFSGSVREGNSGGPVILNNGQVIGMVTDTIESHATSSAAKAEIIVSYVNGLVPKLISRATEKEQDSSTYNNEFCQVLNELLDASKNGFYSIVGTPTNSDNTFHPKIMVPGASSGYVLPKERVYNNLLTDKVKGKVESQFYTVVSKVKECLPKWEEKETTDSAYRFYKFRENKRTIAIVVVYYTLVAQHGNYYLTLSVDIPGPGTLEW